MRNRWFHTPAFHIPSHHFEKKVTWLELFYDLIFVAAFIQLGNGLSSRVSFTGFLGFAAIFATLWVSWTGFTYYANRYTVNDFVHRMIVFVQMFSVGAMAVTAPEVLDNHPARFAFSYAVAQFIISLLYFRSWIQQSVGREYSRFWGAVFGIGGVFWLISGFIASPYCYYLWGAGMAVVLVAPVIPYSRSLTERFPIDLEHLSERYGLLTLIVLGESFVKVLSGLSESHSHLSVLAQAVLTLLLTCCVWWIYFDDVAGSKLKEEKLGPMIWLYAHLPLQMGLTTLGVGINKAVHFNLFEAVPVKYAWLLCGALALSFLSVAVIDAVTERRQAELSDRARVNVRLFSGILFLLLALTGKTMLAGWFLAVVMLICVGQVAFDMMMAPPGKQPVRGTGHLHGRACPKGQGRETGRRQNTPVGRPGSSQGNAHGIPEGFLFLFDGRPVDAGVCDDYYRLYPA